MIFPKTIMIFFNLLVLSIEQFEINIETISSAGKDDVIQGVVPISSKNALLFIKNKNVFSIGSSGRKIIKQNLAQVNEFLIQGVSFSEDRTIIACGVDLLYYLDKNFNELNSLSTYHQKFSPPKIVGRTLLKRYSNEILFGFGIFNDELASDKFEGWIHLYKINSDDYTFSVDTFKLDLTFTSAPNFSYLSCDFFDSGTLIICAYIKSNMGYLGFFDKDNGNFQDPKSLLNDPKGIKIVKLTETLFCAVYYNTMIHTNFHIVNNKKFASTDDYTLSFTPTSETFCATKKDNNTVILAEWNQNTKNVIVYLVSLFTKSQVSSFSIVIADAIQMEMFSFNSEDFGIIMKLENNQLNSVLFNLPSCKEFSIAVYSEQIKTIPISTLSEDYKYLNIKSASTNKGLATVSAGSINLVYEAGVNGKAEIFYSLQESSNKFLSSKICLISVQICNSACGRCSAFSALELEPLCETCFSSDFAEVDGDPSKCYKKNKEIPGYFYNTISSKFQKCHLSCETCTGKGASDCVKCAKNYSKDSSGVCVCNMAWYEENNGDRICVESCPTTLPFKISATNECVSACTDQAYNKIYLNKCVDQCPKDTKEENSECKQTIESLIENIEDVFKDLTKTKNTSTINNSTYQIYENTEEGREEASKLSNASTIDLGECENVLKKEYNIPESEALLIFKLDIARDDQITNQVEYSVFTKDGKKLDLSVCKNEKITITSPVRSDAGIDFSKAEELAKDGYDIYDPNDSFYTDICTPYTSEDQTDVPLEERKKDIYQNVSFCEDNCTYSGINLTTMRVSCECDVKPNMTEEEADFSFNSLTDSFKSVISSSNLKVVKCFKLVFSSKLTKNIGNWIMLTILLLELVVLCFYATIGITPILLIINRLFQRFSPSTLGKTPMVSSRIKFQKKVGVAPPHRREQSSETNYFSNNKNLQKVVVPQNEKPIFPDRVEIKKNVEDKGLIANDSKKKSNFKSVNQNFQEEKKSNPEYSNFFGEEIDSSFDSSKEESVEVDMQQNIIVNDKNKTKTFISENESKSVYSFGLSSSGDSKGLKDGIIKYKKGIELSKEKNEMLDSTRNEIKINKIPYLDEELNLMNFEDSMKNDERGFCRYYYSILKYDQLIIFTFINNTDFNLKLLKIEMFLFCFAMFTAFNALFFTDDTMTHNYRNKGKFDFIYSLPKTIFSSLCTVVINVILNFLSLTQSKIQKLKKEPDIIKAELESKKYITCLKVKVIVFFTLIFSFTLLFWYYTSAFCAVYINTQKHLITDTLISFSLSMAYPFAICFITACFRILALRKQSKCLFWTSKLLQML